MNSLDALLNICRRIGTPAESLLIAFKPRMVDRMVAGQSAVDLGSASILHMRHFQVSNQLTLRDTRVHRAGTGLIGSRQVRNLNKPQFVLCLLSYGKCTLACAQPSKHVTWIFDNHAHKQESNWPLQIFRSCPKAFIVAQCSDVCV